MALEDGLHTPIDQYLISRWAGKEFEDTFLEETLIDLQFFATNKENIREELEVIAKEIDYILDYFGQNVTFYGATLKDAKHWKLIAKFWPEGVRPDDSTDSPRQRLISSRGTSPRTRYGVYMEDIPSHGDLL